MTHQERHPSPGDDMPPDPGPKPDYDLTDPSKWKAWYDAVEVRNRWIRQSRLHLVAKAVDTLSTTVAEYTEPMSPIETLVLILGAAFLEGDGTIGKSGGLFGGLF